MTDEGAVLQLMSEASREVEHLSLVFADVLAILDHTYEMHDYIQVPGDCSILTQPSPPFSVAINFWRPPDMLSK